MTYRIMAHLVAFYPNREASIEVARALVAGGCSYLELQFPFSDPLADGPVIQQACGRALEAGFRTEEGFRLLGQIREIAEVPIFLMSYVNLVFSCGMGEFLRRAKDAGASGLIVPDLPMDSDEGLYDLGHALGLSVVPVVPPGIRSDRIKLVDEKRPDFLYVALRKGITSWPALDCPAGSRWRGWPLMFTRLWWAPLSYGRSAGERIWGKYMRV
jgi:tryptophan synthase alpha chain